ncbi:MAG: Na/Pi cotransporter family protein [Bacteroidales bacterium]|nr:Na/Pi cotransporter family protein [Bacteroidales bacterium]
MSFTEVLTIVINFAGALAVFLFGMKLMSDGLQKFAGNKMRFVMGKVTGSPLSGILTGAAVTTLIQSSSATTVMVVSFVNAGLLSLAGAVAVIMGANIGTTVTAWIITLAGLGEGSGTFSLPMALGAVALLFMFSKRDRMKSIGEFVIGLALLLVGMGLLQQAMPNLEEYPDALEALARLSAYGFWSILIFIVVGALLTCVVQASAAIMAITLVMCYNGWIGMDAAVALVMGQNIGTTITANLAAMVANTSGKRAARAHLVFNVIGVLLTLVVFRPVLDLIAEMTVGLTGSNPYTAVGAEGYSPTAIPMALSLFHTFFNVVNTAVLAWFIPGIVKLVEWLVKEPPEEEEYVYKLKYIGGRWMNTPELNMQAAEREIAEFSKRILRMYSFLPGLRTAKDDEEFEQVEERISKYEEIADRMEMEISQFLTRISEGDLSHEGSQRISAMLCVVDNLESMGDTIYQIAVTRKNKREAAVHFDQHLNDNLEEMTQAVQLSLDIMNNNLNTDYDHIDLSAATNAEEAVNVLRDRLREEHLNALKKGVYDFSIGNAYSSLYALYEKLGDFVINVSEALTVKYK